MNAHAKQKSRITQNFPSNRWWQNRVRQKLLLKEVDECHPQRWVEFVSDDRSKMKSILQQYRGKREGLSLQNTLQPMASSPKRNVQFRATVNILILSKKGSVQNSAFFDQNDQLHKYQNQGEANGQSSAYLIPKKRCVKPHYPYEQLNSRTGIEKIKSLHNTKYYKNLRKKSLERQNAEKCKIELQKTKISDSLRKRKQIPLAKDLHKTNTKGNKPAKEVRLKSLDDRHLVKQRKSYYNQINLSESISTMRGPVRIDSLLSEYQITDGSNDCINAIRFSPWKSGNDEGDSLFD